MDKFSINTKLKIVALQRESLVAPGAPSLSVSARVTEVLDYLESVEDVEYVAIAENDPCVVNAVKWADVVIFSKHSSSRSLELARFCSGRGVAIIYDVDDWIFSFPNYSGGKATNGRKFSRDIMALADVVTVANEKIMAKFSTDFAEINPVLMPNGMWVEKYSDDQSLIGQEAGRPRILFTNADFLKVQNARDGILSALQVFFTKNSDYILDFYGDPFPELFSLPFLHFTNRMPYQEYMRSIIAGGYQFSITPLGAEEDSESAEFNACKNPFKYINYGTAKIPGIYSNAFIYRTCVLNGNTGVLVDNSFDSWFEALELLSGNHALRNSIREAAFQDVMTNFHIRKSASALLKIIDNLL